MGIPELRTPNSRSAENPRTRRIWVVISGVAVASYLLFLSTHYIGDGIRWFHAALGPSVPIGGHNHLAYPALQWMWHRLLALVDVDGHDTMSAVARLQALNALLAAAGLALFWKLVTRLRVAPLAASLATIGLAASYAFAVHATDMTEVMPSFPLAMAATLIAYSSKAKESAIIVPLAAAVMLVLAGFVYLAAFLLAPAVVVMLVVGGGGDEGHGFRISKFPIVAVRAPRAWVFGAAVLAGAASIEGLARLSRDPFASDPTAHGIMGELSISHVLGLLFGLANAQFGLLDWSGGSRILQAGLGAPLLFNLTVIAVSLVALVAMTIWTVSTWRESVSDRPTILVLITWFVVPLGFAAFWNNAYTKLWIIPIAGWWALAALVLSRGTARRRWLVFVPLTALVVATDIGLHLWPNHFQPNAALAEADALARRVGQDDLVVATGSEYVGVYYQSLYTKPYFSYSDMAYVYYGDENGLTTDMNSRICATVRAGGSVYVVSLLDISRNQWADYLGSRLHLSYERLHPLRQASQLLDLGTSSANEPVRVVDRGYC